jgi:hypothetical protein
MCCCVWLTPAMGSHSSILLGGAGDMWNISLNCPVTGQ